MVEYCLNYASSIFKHVLKNCLVTKEWNRAKFISTFEKVKRNDTENYRGVSLLNSGYKIYG